jgi:hypothetical protein
MVSLSSGFKDSNPIDVDSTTPADVTRRREATGFA